MKHAILVGVADDDPEHFFGPGPSLEAMGTLLEQLGDWAIARVEGQAARRAGILAALAELEPRVGPEDAVLFYFFGHGGVVEILDLPPPFGGRPVFYLATARAGRDWSFEGVLDIELSLALARIDRRCGNVSVVLDSCFSAQVVRGPVWTLPESPAWLRGLAERTPDPDADALLHPSSHPRIVRLAAASSMRRGYGDAVEGGHLGRLTSLLCSVVGEAGPSVDRLTWDALAHRVREQAMWRLGCEEQWVSLSGPRQRLLFSRREAPLPRSVGFVPREVGGGGWIRAGTLQGVELGDEWGLAELLLDEDLRPRWRARMRVTATDLNRALLEPAPGEASTAPPGTSALLLRAASREPVFVEDPGLREAIAGSAWLVPHTDQPERFASVSHRADGQIQLCAQWADLPSACFPTDERGCAAAIEWLEDWARGRRLLTVATTRADHGPAPIRVFIKYAGRPDARLLRLDPSKAARVQVGGRLTVSVRCESVEIGCFVTAVLVDVAGRPLLFDEAEPDGLELLPGEHRDMGLHPHRRSGGVELRWPAQLCADRPRQITLIVLASRRPIVLGHLVHPGPSAGIPRDRPRRPRARHRGTRGTPRPRTGPELAHDWGAVVIHMELEPDKNEPAAPEDAAG